MRFVSMIVAVAFVTACGPEYSEDTYVGDDSIEEVVESSYEDDVASLVSGTIGGHLGDFDYFNVEGYRGELFDNSYVSHTTVYAETEDGFVMTRLTLHDGLRLRDLEPGEYVFINGQVTGVGCSGSVEDVWSYDNYSDDVTLFVDETPEGLKIDYQFIFKNYDGKITDELSGTFSYTL